MLEERLNVKLANCDDEHSRKSAVECAATSRRGEREESHGMKKFRGKPEHAKKMESFFFQKRSRH